MLVCRGGELGVQNKDNNSTFISRTEGELIFFLHFYIIDRLFALTWSRIENDVMLSALQQVIWFMK